ncbi:MAG TPA: hypothetical protein VGW33_02810 [Terriglobia bacterium]|nr:hypothetical protein [Terriglobia bacterium]
MTAIWSRSQPWLGKGFLAIIDQGLVAGSGALLSLILARVLVPAQYGAYAVALEAFLLLAAVYGALMLEPMSVFGASVYRDRPREYFGGLFRIHLALALAAMLLLGIAAEVARKLGRWEGLPPALVGVAFAAPCVPIFWLARRAFYVKLAPRRAVQGALLYCAALTGGLAAVAHWKVLTPFAAFVLLAVAGLATGVVLLKLQPSMKLRAPSPSWREICRRHWSYGRWSLGSGVAMWVPAAMYYLLLGKFRGLAVTGALKALVNLTSPVGHIFAAFSLLSLPYAAGVYHHAGSSGIRHVAARLTLLYAGGAAAYWAAIVIFREPILRLLYAGKYQQVSSLVPWVALGSILRIAATAQAIPLRAIQTPSLVFIAYGISGVVAVGIGAPATFLFGLRGAVFTDVAANAVAVGVAFLLVGRSLRGQDPVGRTISA